VYCDDSHQSLLALVRAGFLYIYVLPPRLIDDALAAWNSGSESENRKRRTEVKHLRSLKGLII
jgi:hypothetical protein